MHLSALQAVLATIVVVLTLVGVAMVAGTVTRLVRVIRLGAADPTRSGRTGDRVASLLVESLGHARLGRWPLVGVMHWFVFLGFGALFLTLVTAYGQVFDPAFGLPLLGAWPVYEWFSELFGWLTLLGIVALMVIRQRQH